MSADGPPMTSTGSLLEVEEEEEEEGEGENADDIDEDREPPITNLIENDTSDEYIKANLQRIAALSAETKTVNSASDLYAYGKDVEINAKVEVKIEAGVSAIGGGEGEGGDGEDAQDTFTKLLKATMDQQSAAAESSIGNEIVFILTLQSFLNSYIFIFMIIFGLF